MKMAVFSDSHGNIHLLEQALRIALDSGANLLVHLGDYYDDLGELDYGDAAVYRIPGLPGTDAKAHFYDPIIRFSFGGVRMLAIHDREKLPAEGPACDLVLCGHTHKADCSLGADERWYLNPGHLKSLIDRGEQASFALITALAEGGLVSDFLTPEGETLFSRSLTI